MIRHPPRSTLFPYPPLSRSPHEVRAVGDGRGRAHDNPRRIDRGAVVVHGPADIHPPAELNARLEARVEADVDEVIDRKSTRLNSSHSQISYAVFCLKKKTTT